MKKVWLIFGLLFAISANAKADICYDIQDEKIRKKAADIIDTQTEIYEYCSICQKAEPKKIKVQKVQQSNPILVNGKAIDLAHAYYKKNNIFYNIGVVSGCIKDNDYNISAALSELTVKNNEKIDFYEKAKTQAGEICHKCATNSYSQKTETSEEMVANNEKINDCILAAINKEIEIGFKKEQQEDMKKYVIQIKDASFSFYSDIMQANKYCFGQCGSESTLYPYSDTGYLLQQLLEKLIFLNMKKNGY